MAGAGEVDADAVLSDIEGDDPAPIVIKSSSQDEISVEKFRALLDELDREREAREAAEKSKSDLEVSFNRLKVLAHDAARRLDECGKARDGALRDKEEALKINEKVAGELAEAIRLKDDILKQKEEIRNQFDELSKAKDSLRSEIETSAHMLVTGIEKLSGKVSNFRNFTVGGLPRSQKYTGLPAVAYGVIKRANDIVEELVRQIDTTTKSRNDTREQMEQRNYEIAIEVSQLESTISQLRGEISERTSAVENLEKTIAEKDLNINLVEKDMLEKLNLTEKEALELRQLVDQYDHKLKNLELIMGSVRPLLIDELSYVSKIHDQLYHVIQLVDANRSDHPELSESMFLPQETDMEENVRATLAGMESIFELARIVVNKTSDLVEEKGRETKSLNETVSRLVIEKEHIGSLLRGALSKRTTSKSSSKENDLFLMAENGLKESGLEFRSNSLLRDDKDSDYLTKAVSEGAGEDDIHTLASALENVVMASQLDIIELQHSVEELRAESILLKEHVEAQEEELSHRKHEIEEHEEKGRLANESIEGLMMDIAAAEEEITRWKVAAEQEAAAGRAIEQDFIAQLSRLRVEVEEAKQSMVELEKKVRLKEETADAAMAARDAAEKSLRLADMRAGRLRDRVEELTRQLEEMEAYGDRRGRPRYMCWPWQWLGLEFVGSARAEMPPLVSNEMELSEPLI